MYAIIIHREDSPRAHIRRNARRCFKLNTHTLSDPQGSSYYNVKSFTHRVATVRPTIHNGTFEMSYVSTARQTLLTTRPKARTTTK